MSHKVNALTIVLRDDISMEYAEEIKKAVMLFDGVIDASVNISSIDEHIARLRATSEMRSRLIEFIKELK